jgi:hypothetical protein
MEDVVLSVFFTIEWDICCSTFSDRFEDLDRYPIAEKAPQLTIAYRPAYGFFSQKRPTTRNTPDTQSHHHAKP